MTIITKKFTEKQPDKAEISLVAEDEHTVDILDPSTDEEEYEPFQGLCGYPLCSSLSVFAAACGVLVLGTMGGLYLYEQYGRETTPYQGWCQIPYGEARANPFTSQEAYQNDIIESAKVLIDNFMNEDRGGYNLKDEISNYFKEHFEIGVDEELYEKIDVPEFENSRHARFIHDFNMNMTGIIDPGASRCYVMPLDRNAVLPPKSLLDLVNKMWSGHYNINMQTVKQNMRVVLPSVDDFSDIGVYITKECQNMPTYRLQNITHDVVKRSTDGSSYKFTQFAGKFLQELDIVNFEEVLQHEEGEKNIHGV